MRARWALCLACVASTVAAAPPAPRRQPPPSASAAQEQQEISRRERRERRRALLAALWGPLSAEPAGIAEFDLHAWRMARLRRIERLATEVDRPLLLERVGKLITKEQARHVKHLKRLKDERAAPAAAAPGLKASAAPHGPKRKD